MKVRVAVLGTIGKSVLIDTNLSPRVNALEEAVAQLSAGGARRHSELLGLQIGDDHPQYTLWQAPETIQAPWNFAVEPDIEGIPLTEFIQDVIGGLTLVDSSSIDFTYNDLAGTISAATINADPTASIGLAAVNGTAATPMRSDGAPALSQAIAPNWSANHTWVDNAEVRLGTGADMRLFHDGTDSFIRNDTGILALAIGANAALQFNTSRAFGVDGANYGNSGEVLTSQGASAAPIWATAGGGSSALYDVQVNNLSITSNNVLQDTDLVQTLTAGTWLITLDLMQTQNSTPQMETTVDYTGTVTSVAGIVFRMRGNGTAFSNTIVTAFPYAQTETTSDTVFRRGSIRLTVSTGGDVKVRARQVNSSGTAVTFLAGSSMKAVKIS